jgi:hypothetical protein
MDRDDGLRDEASQVAAEEVDAAYVRFTARLDRGAASPEAFASALTCWLAAYFEG